MCIERRNGGAAAASEAGNGKANTPTANTQTKAEGGSSTPFSALFVGAVASALALGFLAGRFVKPHKSGS